MTLLLCNVCWMRRYAGVTSDDIPRHGGEYVREHGYGHEAINFAVHRGTVYGFVELRTGTINITRLDVSAQDSVDGVLVVWRARSHRGSVVVGWYKNATVHRYQQKPPSGRSFGYRGKTIAPWWTIKTNASNTFIVPPDRRFFTVPVSHKGFGSQTFVSFLDSDDLEVADFKQRLLRYIADAESGHYREPRHGTAPPIDQVRKLAIERAAIKEASQYYGGQGYDVTSVESENLGYDLEARCKAERLLIEVKGTSHDVSAASVNLSPNEYRRSKSRRLQYRICIVTNALGSPAVNDFRWDTEGRTWTDESTGRSLSVSESISADMTIR